MEFEYDSWNRIQTITYPDKEKVNYTYNLGGMLNKIEGNKNGTLQTYIENIEYNAFELKSVTQYGNGTATSYDYDILQRLSHLTSYTHTGENMQNIDYNYDKMSNITQINNLAGSLGNGLGGDYQNDYGYDHLYRLISAQGNWNSKQCNFTLSVEYTQNGRITKKTQTADILDYMGNITPKSYSNKYLYHNLQPNTLKHVNNDNVPDDFQDFEWDGNGNMILHRNAAGFNRQLCWDEENRLLGVKDDVYSSFYQYDAAGERTYKLTGAREDMLINGQWVTAFNLINPTLYASPYLVATDKGYTKHYYAENERIASNIGNGGLQEICMVLNLEKNFNDKVTEEDRELKECSQKPHDNMVKKMEKTYKFLSEVMDCINSNAVTQFGLLKYLYDLQSNSSDREEGFWYHPDHLGSSSWVTDQG
ncbi:MAG: hypothetical protein RR263_03200, partial [Oscillospiraceae bacterium]